MNMKSLNPFNWFKKEQEQDAAVPVVRNRDDQFLEAPTAPFRDLAQEMDRVFEDFSRRFGLAPFGRSAWLDGTGLPSLLRPSLDIVETNDRYEISVELPGVSQQDLSVDVAGGTLRIRGEKSQQNEETRGQFHRIERSYGAFARVLNLPEDADPDKISARYEAGVLRVQIPRRKSGPHASRLIEVRAA